MPAQELRRARSARHYLIDGPLMDRLGTTLELISRSMGFPVVRVNIVDADSQHSVSLFGADPDDGVSRAEAFCDTVVRSGRPLQVPDATADPRFSGFPAVINGEIGAYLGVPLAGRESLIVGAVCVTTTTGGRWTLGSRPGWRSSAKSLRTNLI